MVRLCLSMQPSFIALVNVNLMVNLDLVDVGPLVYVNLLPILSDSVSTVSDSVRQ